MSKKIKSTFRLYHGTTEMLAKSSPVVGLSPYNLPLYDCGVPRNFFASTADSLCLTSVYPGYMAFETCGSRDRWGMLEIDMDQLDESKLMPHEAFLIEKSKKKIMCAVDQFQAMIDYRGKLLINRHMWRQSLEEIGLCVYQGSIPARAVTKITVYDPRSNWTMTKEILRVSMTTKSHRVQAERQKLVRRWLMCENVEPNEWVNDYMKLPGAEREKISTALHDKSGLDIFHSIAHTGRR